MSSSLFVFLFSYNSLLSWYLSNSMPCLTILHLTSYLGHENDTVIGYCTSLLCTMLRGNKSLEAKRLAYITLYKARRTIMETELRELLKVLRCRASIRLMASMRLYMRSCFSFSLAPCQIL